MRSYWEEDGANEDSTSYRNGRPPYKMFIDIYTFLYHKVVPNSSFIQYSVWRQVQSLLQNDAST